MKKIITSILIFIMILLYNCSQQNVRNEKLQTVEKTKVKVTEKGQKKRTGIIKGKIEIYKGKPEVYIVLNWESKSRVTYRVINPNKFDFKKKAGRIIEVEAEIVQLSEFTGEVKILKIVKVY
jgi:hypothetical protein